MSQAPSPTLPSVSKLLEIPTRVDTQDTRILTLEAEMSVLTHQMQLARAEVTKTRQAHNELVKAFDSRVEKCLLTILAKINPRMHSTLTKHSGHSPTDIDSYLQLDTYVFV